MTLTEKEYRQFLKIHLKLLFFVGLKKVVIPTDLSFNKFVDLDLQTKFKCRETLLKNGELLDEYVASNFDHLSNDEVKILYGFKKRITSNFIILKCLTRHAVFIDTNDNKFYAVKALSDPFYKFFDRFPVHITTTLIPFNDKIIYDGFIQSSGIHFGGNITRTMNEEYKHAKGEKLLLTRLDE